MATKIHVVRSPHPISYAGQEYSEGANVDVVIRTYALRAGFAAVGNDGVRVAREVGESEMTVALDDVAVASHRHALEATDDAGAAVLAAPPLAGLVPLS